MFTLTFIQLKSQIFPSFELKTSKVCDPAPNVLFSYNQIVQKLENLDANKSMGPDMIHSFVIKKCAKAFAVPLNIIYQKSFEIGELPTIWKQANVTPLHKGGNKLDPANYRPVSLTCVLCKVMESLVKDSMLKHLLDNNLISEAQHGFMPFRSCSTNLLEYLDIISDALSKGYPVDVVYTDFAKAFDKVSHSKLVYKLKFYGFNERMVKWIKSFLSGRVQQVVLGEVCSEWAQVTSGVPQGSVLGPVLFIIYINDLLELIGNDSKAYADDNKIISIIKNFYSNHKLQLDIDRVCKWSRDWSAQLNIEKCKVVHFGRNNMKYDYEIESRTLNKSDCEKDLGVYISNDLKWEAQIGYVTAKANRILGMLKKSFKYPSINVIKLLYTSLVRPHLEYAISSWCPHLKKDLEMIEKV